jgi:type IV secretory pathway VirB2 component (pilin)
MKLKSGLKTVTKQLFRPDAWAIGLLFTLSANSAYAQGTDPWTLAVQQLEAAFTGPIARGLSLVAIVVGGLMFAFGESGDKRMLAGIVFGVGMAISAANFLTFLFG